MTDDELLALRATAVLLARLLLTECDADTLRSWDEMGVRPELEGMGLTLPAADDEAALQQLAAEYFEAFVNPQEGLPPVQSLHEEGAYEGRAAKSMQEIADAAGVSFDRDAARGAPVDHLGVQLVLWAELAGRDLGAAEVFRERHLVWAEAALTRVGGDALYRRLAEVVREFVGELGRARG